MDLRRLEIFVKVAQLGSFSRAAEALFLTQPTVSEHIRALEDELGIQLLDRLGRGAVPTRAGQLFLGYAQRLLALAREARQAVDQFQGRMSGELVVGGSTIPGEYLLPALIGQFRGKYPEIRMALHVGSSREVIDWVEDGQVELGVVGSRPTSRVIESRELVSDDLVVIVPTGHPWWERGTVTVAEVQAEPLIIRERGSGTREALEHAIAEAGVDFSAFRVVGEMGSTQAIKQGVRAGVGVALISKRAVHDECKAGLVHCLTVEDLRVTRAFHLAMHRDRSRSPLATAFLQFLESQFPSGAS